MNRFDVTKQTQPFVTGKPPLQATPQLIVAAADDVHLNIRQCQKLRGDELDVR